MSEATPPIEPVTPVGPAAAAAHAPKVEGPWLAKVTGRHYGNGNFKAAAGDSWGQVKNIVGGSEVTLGERAKGFGRVAGVGVGAYIASGALQSKNADGTDRGALHRLGNLVLGGGIAAGSVFVHGR